VNDEADVLRTVVQVLERLAVPYMIGGSMALAVWAVPRMTHDVDLVVDLPEAQIPTFCAQFSPERYTIDPQAMGAAFRARSRPSQGMDSFTDLESGLKVDLFPLRPADVAQQAALGRRQWVEILEGLRAAVYAPDDLLVQKLRWYALGQSERQFRDCLNLVLTDGQRPQQLIAWEYVDTWAAQLGAPVQRAWALIKAAVQQAIPGPGASPAPMEEPGSA
jgi:hypothetical protein